MTPFIALAPLLDDLLEMCMGVTPEVYVAKPMPGVSGSIGEHVRHTIDHIRALLTADRGELSYDHRHRGTAIEADLAAAVEQILILMATIERKSARSQDDLVLVTSMLPGGGDPVTAWSTLGREVAFVASHTIHHQALIALLLAFHGVGVPQHFGYAPSTLAAQ